MRLGDNNLRSKIRALTDGAATGLAILSTVLVVAPLLLMFVVFQRRFVSSFVFSGIK